MPDKALNSNLNKNIILISGGTKSGKSEFAENIAKNYSKLTYIALSEKRSDDKDWQIKISKHKRRRPIRWNLIETEDLFSVLDNEDNVLLIDSIGGFVTCQLNKNDIEWEKICKLLIQKFLNFKKDIILVSEQTGWGLVSEYKIGNIFIERLGYLLKEITKIANQNWLTINGKAINLDNLFSDIDF